MKLSYEEAKEYIKNLGFDLDIEEYPKVKENIECYVERDDIKGLDHYMINLQNCGGFALQIPACIFPGDEYTLEEKVLRIIELYPFVRLLSDSKVKENEYIVKFRSSGKTGHHFVRIDEYGNIMEKYGGNLPGKFKDWGIWEDAPEAVFAVLKQNFRDKEVKELLQCNIDMHLDQNAYYEINYYGYLDYYRKDAVKPQTFTDLLKDAYNHECNSFKYNNKTFYFKKDNAEPDIIYICNETQILGEFYTDGVDFIIELDEDKKNLIYGFQPTKPLEFLKSYQSEGLAL